jgi:hypothetical protein
VAGIDHRVDRRSSLFLLEILGKKITGGLTCSPDPDQHSQN